MGTLEVAGRVAGSRTRVSESRVRTLLDAVERLAQDSDPNLADYVARLEAEIAQRQQELRRLEGGGEFEAVDDDQLVEEAENVLHLARELPADFARVAESIKAMQREVVTDLRQDIRPTGEVLREYLERGQQIMDAPPEGRAFDPSNDAPRLAAGSMVRELDGRAGSDESAKQQPVGGRCCNETASWSG